jgi:hypothetical protein
MLRFNLFFAETLQNSALRNAHGPEPWTRVRGAGPEAAGALPEPDVHGQQEAAATGHVPPHHEPGASV